MHRSTPLAAAFRAYSAGGARSVVDSVNDNTLMQEMKGKFMANESRDKFEAPQNYGFSSVVLPATQGEGGKKDGAEAFISFIGGSRSFAVAGVMDDRRHRPMGLKPGENAQYDDLGQMTLIRRTGTYMLTTDNPDESQSGSGGGGGGGGGGGKDGSGGGQQVERMVSLRHVEKKKQERQKPGGSGGGQDGGGGAVAFADSGQGQTPDHSNYKHEGDSVNHEVRVTKKRIEFRSGDKVVGYYDKEADTWFFTAKVIHAKATSEVKDEAPKISHN